jgi:hypothetical protein
MDGCVVHTPPLTHSLAHSPSRSPNVACSWADPGYMAGDAQEGPDPLQLALAGKEAYQAIRALPVEAGGAVIFTHR